MKLRDYTVPELEYLKKNCNFTEDEQTYFDLKSKDLSNIKISLKMHISISQVSKIAKRVSLKISRITNK